MNKITLSREVFEKVVSKVEDLYAEVTEFVSTPDEELEDWEIEEKHQFYDRYEFYDNFLGKLCDCEDSLEMEVTDEELDVINRIKTGQDVYV